jgi:hypothetical protein
MQFPPTDAERVTMSKIAVVLDEHFAALDILGGKLYQKEGLSQANFLALYEHASGDDELYRQHLSDAADEDDPWDSAPREADHA